jgi:hypothetical protein
MPTTRKVLTTGRHNMPLGGGAAGTRGTRLAIAHVGFGKSLRRSAATGETGGEIRFAPRHSDARG